MNRTDGSDGGPAFPHDNQELGDRHRIAQPGMSLRDWFAGQALAVVTGMMADNTLMYPESVSDAAFAIADAMLKAREES